jgi:hypothetical protein
MLSCSCCEQVAVTTHCPSLFSYAYTSMFLFELTACYQRLHWLVAPSRPSSLGEIRNSRRPIEILRPRSHMQKLSPANVLTAALRVIAGVVILVITYRCHSKIPKHPLLTLKPVSKTNCLHRRRCKTPSAAEATPYRGIS